MITKILIANRSEIAERVIRTARDLGISTVVGYADADLHASFTAMADEAYALGGTSYAETYMNGEKHIEIARRSGADAVHPGYGFLSEIPEFAQAVIDAGLTWIGPSPDVLARLGDKIEARRIAESVDVQPVPGISEPVGDRAEIEAFIERWGYPVVTKKADGGGGRGITAIRSEKDLDTFFLANDGNTGDFFVEKFIESARHIETQCMRDSQGNFRVVSTRDCSIQRRNQKLIEEAPATGLSERTNETLVRWSKALFDAVGFEGLGTCEFLVEGDDVYFLEVNPRLQVEHTVSEEVTGLDLVAEQIRIADGGLASDVPAPRATSFEFRINCEDPRNDMRPSQGTITSLRWPLGHGVRIESGITEGDVVTSDFDPMLAKIIVSGPDRPTAIARARRALAEFKLDGVAHAAELYRDILATDEFANLNYSTRWFEEEFLETWAQEQPEGAASPSTPSGTAGQPATDSTSAGERATFVIEIDGKRTEITVPHALVGPAPSRSEPRPQPLRHTNRRRPSASRATGETATGDVCSPIQAIVVRVTTSVGQKVEEGDLLVVLESMKMESYVHAPIAGEITKISVADGDNVTPGMPLVCITPAS